MSSKKPGKIASLLQEDAASEAQNELSFLFRSIVFSIGMTPASWAYRMQRYLDEKDAQKYPNPPKDEEEAEMRKQKRDYNKGNYDGQFSDTRMTMRTFKEGIAFLGPIRTRLTVDMEWPGGKFTRNHVNITSDMDDSAYDLIVRPREQYSVGGPSLTPEEDRMMRQLLKKAGYLTEDGSIDFSALEGR